MHEYEQTPSIDAAETLDVMIATPEFAYEPTEPQCVDQLGFVAVCAACPLLRMFGECPKELREQATEIRQPSNEGEPLDFSLSLPILQDSRDILLDDFGPIQTEQESLVVVSVEDTPPRTLDRPHIVEPYPQDQPMAVPRNEQRRARREQKRPVVSAPVEPSSEKQPPAAVDFRALLFDDSVPIVTSFSPQSESERVTEPLLDTIEAKTLEVPLSKELPLTPLHRSAAPIEELREIPPETPVEVRAEVSQERAKPDPLSLVVTAQPSSQPDPKPELERESIQPAPEPVVMTLHRSVTIPHDEAAPLIEQAAPIIAQPEEKPLVAMSHLPKKAQSEALPLESTQPVEVLERSTIVPMESVPIVCVMEGTLLDSGVDTPTLEYEDVSAYVPPVVEVPDDNDDPEEVLDFTGATPERLTPLLQKDINTHKRTAQFTLGFLALLLLTGQSAVRR